MAKDFYDVLQGRAANYVNTYNEEDLDRNCLSSAEDIHSALVFTYSLVPLDVHLLFDGIAAIFEAIKKKPETLVASDGEVTDFIFQTSIPRSWVLCISM